jgi:hypothetical protein
VGLGVVVVVGLLILAALGSASGQLVGERLFVARVLGVSARGVVSIAPNMPLVGLKAQLPSRGFTVQYTFARGMVNTVAPLFEGKQQPTLEDPAKTPPDRGKAAARAVQDYLGAIGAKPQPQEVVDPAGRQFHQVNVDLPGPQARLASRYVVRFDPQGRMLGMYAQQSEPAPAPSLGGGRPTGGAGR